MSRDPIRQTEAMPISIVRLDGSPRLALMHAGQGELVLFMHGIGGNKSNWAAQLPVFARHFTAVAWDARGYGESDDYDGPFDFADVSQDILRVLDYFGVRTAHLVGLSMGGRLAFDFTRRHPEAVRSLTVCSAADRASNMTPERRRAFLESRLRPLQSGLTPADIAPVVARSLLGPNASEAVYELLRQSMADLHPQSYIKALESVSLNEGGIELEAMRTPTHVVAAANDPLYSLETLRAMASRIPNSVFSEISDCGHLSNLERPEQFNAAVLEFILRIVNLQSVKGAKCF
ncbi:MAG: alpha/beta fold hydrolase [Xanthobacteraceae bacterium]